MIGPPEMNDPDGALCRSAGVFAVLAIDQSSDSSGWALHVQARAFDPTHPYERTGFTRIGLAADAAARRGVVESAKREAARWNVPLGAVLEDHRSFAFARGNMSVSSAMGMGAARGRWEQELEAAGIRDVHLVEPRVWRKAVLGLGGSVKGDSAKAAARLHARAVLGTEVSDDEAEALCMALWAERALTVRTLRGGVVRLERLGDAPEKVKRGKRGKVRHEQ